MKNSILFVNFCILISISSVFASCSVFGDNDPNIKQLTPFSISVSWTEVPNALYYMIEEEYPIGSNNWEIVKSMATWDTDTILFVNPATNQKFRMVTRTDGDKLYSCPNNFPGTVIPVNENPEKPYIQYISPKELLITWESFGPANFVYLVEVFSNQEWIIIATENSMDEKLSMVLYPYFNNLNLGIPYFYRISRGNVSTPSTEFTTSPIGSANSFNRNSVRVLSIPPTDSSNFAKNQVGPFGKQTDTKLGGTGNFQTLVKYFIPSPFDQCSVLYAKLVWNSTENMNVNFEELDGGIIRAYTDLDKMWTSDSLDELNVPVPNDPNVFISSTQISKNATLLELPLDRELYDLPSAVELISTWTQDSSLINYGILLTLEETNYGELYINELPDLVIAFAPLSPVTEIKTSQVEPDGETTQDGEDCTFCGKKSVCNFDVSNWEDKIQMPEELALSTNYILYQVNVTLSGSFDTSPALPERLTISLQDGVIADTFLTEGNSIDCGDNSCTMLSFSSPIYPPDAGGWPNFSNDISNNYLYINYTGEMCWSSIDISFGSILQSPDPNCAPSASSTPTMTPTPSSTPSLSRTPSVSFTQTPTSSNTPTPSSTITESGTPTSTMTPSTSNSPTSSKSLGASQSNTPTVSITKSVSPSNTASSTRSKSESKTPTFSTTTTPTRTPSPSHSQTGTPSTSLSATRSRSLSNSETPSISTTRTPTRTPSISLSLSSSVSESASSSISLTMSNSPSLTRSTSFSRSVTPSVTSEPSKTPTASTSYSNSISISLSTSPSQTVTRSKGSSASTTPSESLSNQPSKSLTPSPSSVPSSSATNSITRSSSITPSISESNSHSVTSSITQSTSVSPCPTPINIGEASPSVSPIVASASPSISISPSISLEIVPSQIPIDDDTPIVIITDDSDTIIGEVIFQDDLQGTDAIITIPLFVPQPNRGRIDSTDRKSVV